MEDILSQIANISNKNPLTKDDMKLALEAYNIEYCDTSIKEINYWTGMEIEKTSEMEGHRKDILRLLEAIKEI
jgi:hypothetical protein